jgi:hypothetical protein
MPTSSWARGIVFVTAGMLALVALALGLDVAALLKFVGAVTIVVTVALWFFNALAWKWLPVKATKRPNIDGTWKVWLEAEWRGFETGKPGSRRCYLVVHQTFRRVTVTALFPDSESESFMADISERNGRYRLAYIYDSKAEPQALAGNPPHSGTTILTISLKPKALRGNYWGDRPESRGTMTGEGFSNQHYDHFAEAERGQFQ